MDYRQGAVTEHTIIFLGALAGGFVSGLTGFGTGLTAIGIWLYVAPPSVAASLVVICSVVSQLQTLPAIWRSIAWKRVLPFVLPGLVGVPVGTGLLSGIDLPVFKFSVGAFLIAYAAYVLVGRLQLKSGWGGRAMDAAIGFGGGVLGGLAGLSGPPVVIWTDVRGYAKDVRRSILQTFNLSILALALISHAAAGLLTRDVGWAVLAALPGTICGAWLGSTAYGRLGDHGFQNIVMVLLLLLSGAMLIWTSV